ncbi:SIMPL domain-containing protein [Geopsychrobacter electrodiphilus]|uniref:SIMPL domain-containing protein n=1 Tax=Geopsychrobacter electrodiphilus TaxID=225196 RepID=UPI00037BBE81|nr:SIMPL domain-containing protein [Geopsychrobacter electrodiphilus]
MRYLYFLLPVLFLSACVPPQPVAAQKQVSQLSVRGEATLKVKPDQVEMSLEAVTTGATADAAMVSNNAAMGRLQQLLLTEGLTSADYHTGQFSIQPQWSRPPRPAPANWAPEIVGYQVNNSLQIATTHVELAGHLLALAQQAGVNKASQLRFSLADSEISSRQAIAEATNRARQRAETLASAAGVKLGRLLEARVDDSGAVARPMLMMAEGVSARAVNNVPLNAGEVEVHAAVILRYALVD